MKDFLQSLHVSLGVQYFFIITPPPPNIGLHQEPKGPKRKKQKREFSRNSGSYFRTHRENRKVKNNTHGHSGKKRKEKEWTREGVLIVRKKKFYFGTITLKRTAPQSRSQRVRLFHCAPRYGRRGDRTRKQSRT